MFQDIRLKTDESNQFLGDMFEGFLDQGVKQSEGQFFTPMPFVKFIISSLPLENIIKDNEQIPKVIDYAGGAGHFVNEYASQIKPYVEKHKKTDISEYYSKIVGIDKEYRLSKVAKVSAFMYGQDDIKIIYNDALAEIPDVKDGEFSILVSNPPYSVKGFLETLSVKDRNRFELINTIDEKNFANNNSIEAFFIERAKHLLESDGFAGIIMPSSILSKGNSKNASKKQNVYVATREILLKNFDIVAIAEFGSGTFGKTGTNTVTLFLKRKKENPAPAGHYKNRVDAWFKNDMSKNGVFADGYLIIKYCNHLEYNFDDYKTLLEGSPNDSILNTDVFKEYRKDFDNSAEIKNRKNQYKFKALSKDDQKPELDKKFLEYLQNAESEKLYYFVLASLNPTDVVIVKTPTDKDAKKKFLGYEWSSAKGNEGIKYLGGETITVSDVAADEDDAEATLEEEDIRVLSNILNLNNIQTPLYDPKNLENPDKINSIIRANFNRKPIVIPEVLKEYVTTAKLVNMLDFSRKEFNKAISLTPKKTITIDTKWNLVKLDQLASIDYGKPMSEKQRVYGVYPVVGSNGIVGWHNEFLVKDPCIVIGRKGSAGEINWYDENCFPIDTTFYIKEHSDNINLKYLYLILEHIGLKNLVGGTGVPGLNRDDIYNQKIPVPSPEIQNQIVIESEAIEKEFEKATKEIEEAKKEIDNKVTEVISKGINKKIANLNSLLKRGKSTKYGNSNIQVIKSGQARGYEEFDFTERHFAIDSFCSDERNLQKGDLLINSTGVGTAGRVTLFNLDGDFVADSHITIFRPSNEILSKYALYCLANIGFKTIEGLAKGSSGQIELTLGIIGDIELPVVDLNIQKALITEIEKQEDKIRKAQAVIESIPERKKEVMKKYL